MGVCNSSSYRRRRTSYSERGRRGHVLDAVSILSGVGYSQFGELDALVVSVDLELDAFGRRQRLSVEQPLTVCTTGLGQVAGQRRRLALETFHVLHLQRDAHRLVCRQQRSRRSEDSSGVARR